jgi:hypothetical protein
MFVIAGKGIATRVVMRVWVFQGVTPAAMFILGNNSRYIGHRSSKSITSGETAGGSSIFSDPQSFLVALP